MFVEWEAKLCHEPKKPLEKVHFLNSQGSEAITEADYDTMHHPTWPRKKFSQTPRNGALKKKRSHSNRKASRWGLFILGIVVPNEKYPKGLSYRKWIVTRKSDGWFHMIGPSWGTLPFGVWIYI